MEQLIALEGQLEHQRELVQERLDDLIHLVDKRFEAFDKRFSLVQWDDRRGICSPHHPPHTVYQIL